jgi:hypothetical protein
MKTRLSILVFTIVLALAGCNSDEGEASLPDAPSNLTASSSFADKIDLTWAFVDGTEGYEVFRAAGVATDNSDNLNFILRGEITSNSYSDSGLTAGSSYFYKIRTKEGESRSEFTNAVFGFTIAAALDRPLNLIASTNFTNKIELSWSQVSEAECYEILKASGNASDNPDNLTFQQVGQASQSAYEDTNLPFETSFWYKVKAKSSSSQSEFSTAVFGETTANIIDPNDPNAIAGALIISGSVTTGTPPPTSTLPGAPVVSGNQSSATVSNDNTLYLPFNYATTSGGGAGYGGCYVQVNGASTYWDIPYTGGTPQNGQIIIPVGIPANVGNGNFCLTYCIYDNNNQVSNLIQTCIEVAPAKNCPGSESGSDGLTIFTYDLGPVSGNVSIDYNTYSVPDRIDIFYNNTWIDGTGSSLNTGQFPPVMDCDTNPYVDGYVGETGTFNFAYNPANGTEIDVYVSGCVGGGTAWDVDVSCPE